MRAALGCHSWQRIAYDSKHMRIYDVQLTLNEHASHNTILPSDGLLFVSDGQVFIQTLADEISVKANQSLWLPHHQAIRCVALSPSCRLFVIVFPERQLYSANHLQRFTSGTEQKKQLNSGVTLWTANDQHIAKVEWRMFPAHHQEPLYYLSDSEQFILPINTSDQLHASHSCPKHSIIIGPEGHVFSAQTPHTLINTSDKPITFFTVMAPAPRYNHVYKLTR